MNNNIVTVPDPVLTKPAKNIGRIDKKIIKVVNLMKTTLQSTNKPKGVGLAAPQIGIPLRIFITKPTDRTPIEVFINPEITHLSKDLSEIVRPNDGTKSLRREKKLEGCLSIPKVWGYLKRHTKVKFKFLDISGQVHETEFSGFMSTIVQHEIDHLNGILFTQRVLEQKEKLYRIEVDKNGQEKLVEIEL